MPVLERLDTPTILATAAALAQELAASAVERDRTAGVPTLEVSRLRDLGLLSLVVPQEYGGAGADLVTLYQVVKELAKADGSIGQLYVNHVGLVTLAHSLGTAAQKERDYRGTAQHQWFWGNAINTRDERLKLTPDGEGFRLNGEKGFGTGIPAADRWVFSAVQDGVELPFFLAIPSDRVIVLCPNPGRIHRELKIDLPRPRRRSSLDFQRLKEQLIGELDLTPELDLVEL